jgi:hypothetical protein
VNTGNFHNYYLFKSADPDPVTKGQPETDVQFSRRFETLRSSKINSGLRITHSFDADLGPEFSKSMDPDFEAMPQKNILYSLFKNGVFATIKLESSNSLS